MKASEIGNPKWKRGLILDSAIRNGTGFKLFRNPQSEMEMSYGKE
jgi:hypothetical protein